MKEFLDRGKNRLHRILRWSEKYTKTDMVYLASGGFWLGLGTAIAAVLSFILAVVFANFLPKEVYGTYSFVLAMAAILAIPTLTGMGTAVTRTVAQGYDGTAIKALFLRLRWGVLAILISLGVATYYFINENTTLGTAFVIVAALMPLMESFTLYSAVLTGKQKFKTNTLYGTSAHIFAAAIIISVVLLSNNIFLILFSYFASWGVTRAFLFFITKRRFLLAKETDLSALGYGKHLSLMTVFSTVANNLDKIVIFHFLGAAQVAIYVFAAAIPEQIKAMSKNITNLALPSFSKRTTPEIQNGLLHKIGTYSLIMVFIIAGYITAAPFIFSFFFPQYLDSIVFSQIYALSLIGTANLIPFTALKATGQTGKLYVFNISSAIIYILALVVLVIMYGILGAVLAMIFKRLFNLTFSTILFKF